MIRTLLESPFVFAICAAALALLIAQFLVPKDSLSRKTRRTLRVAAVATTALAIGLTATRFVILGGG